MRRIFLLLGCVIVTGCGASAPRVAVPMVPMHEESERETTRELDALGTWSDEATHGLVWMPNDASFVPYETDGQWVTLGDGATFVSDVSWALPTYSRGRWFSRETPAGQRWCWAAHGTPAPIVPADVETRAISPNELRVVDLANVAVRTRAIENAARMSEPNLLAMHGAPAPDSANRHNRASCIRSATLTSPVRTAGAAVMDVAIAERISPSRRPR
jgi:hypothetical protein